MVEFIFSFVLLYTYDASGINYIMSLPLTAERSHIYNHTNKTPRSDIGDVACLQLIFKPAHLLHHAPYLLCFLTPLITRGLKSVIDPTKK